MVGFMGHHHCNRSSNLWYQQFTVSVVSALKLAWGKIWYKICVGKQSSLQFSCHIFISGYALVEFLWNGQKLLLCIQPFSTDYSSQWDRSLFTLSAVEFKESLHFPWLNEWEGKGPVYRASPCLPAPLLFWWWAYRSPKENAVWAVCIVRFDVTDINISPLSAFTTEPYGGNIS